MSDDALTVRDRLAAGHYDVSKAERQALSYEAEESLWRARYAEFKADALRETGLLGHPKADRAFALAENLGDGLIDMLRVMGELRRLLLED